jgi:hypothetical protein
MLKYQLNTRFIRNDMVPIELYEYSSEKLLGDEFKDKMLLTCYSDGELTFGKDASIMAMYEQYMVNDDFISSTAYNFNTIYHPAGINKENRSFSIIYDKYFDLEVEKTSVTTELVEGQVDPQKTWWYIWFKGSHLFDVSGDNTYKLYITFDGPNGYNEVEPPLKVDSSTFVTSSILRFPYSVLNYIVVNGVKLEDVIFYEEDGQMVSDVSRVRFFRDNFVFTIGMFQLYLDRAMATISLPIEQKFSTDLYQDDNIREYFTGAEVKKSINKITEMEKDVYHPVIWQSNDDDDNYGSVKDEVYKIRFNLHFRTHRGDDWLADSEGFWNGVDASEPNNLKPIKDYFTYANEEKQSDLLTYLNFSNKDVRFQKNKLKKSFLRVMFFDSTNPANQNMLAYYTVFMDSGGYFSKYARYIESDNYRKIDKDPNERGEYEVKPDLSGIRVDREPYYTAKKKPIDESTNADDIEEVRLSSQFVVEEKYMSDASSEGFYLYLWKDNFLGTCPQDIYMKVEFNHAGYGRTVPFMCPFKDSKKDEDKGFKSFNKILSDWSNDDSKYGIVKYMKYSYIHFKYKYDKITERHVYYLDDEFYGTEPNAGGVYFDDNAITINLYEAKII